MTDPVTTVTDAVDKAKDVVKPEVAKVIPWRDRYLQYVAAHPKTVSVILAVAVVWAVVASIRV